MVGGAAPVPGFDVGTGVALARAVAEGDGVALTPGVAAGGGVGPAPGVDVGATCPVVWHDWHIASVLPWWLDGRPVPPETPTPGPPTE